METNSSGEDLVVKQTRKPYTITKQREKWTEEEHNKFIEALKLYGRAWQRIEEHIGTKTAVQIRSHAQKFFTKLEKEAVMKGGPLGQAHDIEIPPPRPKRKPSSPYPRKTGAGFSPSAEAIEEKTSKSSSPLSTCKKAMDLENNASWKIQGARDDSEDGSCSEVLNLFQDAPAASISSLTKGSSGVCANNGFMPLNKEIKDKTTLKGSSMSLEMNRHMNRNITANANHGSGELKGTCISSQMKSAQEGENISKQPEKISLLLDSLQGDQSHTKHVPIDFMKGSGDGSVPATVAGQGGAHAKPTTNPTISSTSEMNTNSGVSSIHQSFPPFPSFTQFPSSQDAYRLFLNISSTFSCLIMSTLLQNPAVYAAASVAASFWPTAGLDASVDSASETAHGGIPTRSMNASPSMAAIAAATISAASAWWATQGLLPIYPPLHTEFTFAPAPTATIPTVDTARAPDCRKEERGEGLENLISIGIDQQDIAPEQSEAVRAQHPTSKSLSSSDSEESATGELMGAKTIKSKPLLNNAIHDSDKARNKKKLDRSSCGFNTPSSSEVETAAVLKKQDGDKNEAKQAPLSSPPSAETNTRRFSSSSSLNESCKEGSEEAIIRQTILITKVEDHCSHCFSSNFCLYCQGWLAFQALFNREVWPRSFSPPHAKDLTVMTAKVKEATIELPVDLNMKASNEPSDVYYVQEFGDESGKGSLTSDICQGKLKARRTGFKPYKRCSMEAKESRATTGDETGNKRIRLEGETSI